MGIAINWKMGMFFDNDVKVVETPSVHIQITSSKRKTTTKQVQQGIKPTPVSSEGLTKGRQKNTNEVPILDRIHVYTRDFQQWNKNNICKSLPSF